MRMIPAAVFRLLAESPSTQNNDKNPRSSERGFCSVQNTKVFRSGIISQGD